MNLYLLCVQVDAAVTLGSSYITLETGKQGGSSSSKFRWKAWVRGELRRWGCLGNHPPLPVSSCQSVHQRTCTFRLSTRLWMKELARARFQLFIACKPERWRERGNRRNGVCAWRMHGWALVSLGVCSCVSMSIHITRSQSVVFLHFVEAM